ncbi:nitrogen regulation protein NIFR3 [Staphylococcus aureus]|nr:nitrogen regulation protein NIFR3 [Staphylococcus aureus]
MEIKLSCVIGIKDINQSNRHYNAYWRGPNKEADEKSAYNNVQVGEGSQHREFRKEILQAMQVGEGQQI